MAEITYYDSEYTSEQFEQGIGTANKIANAASAASNGQTLQKRNDGFIFGDIVPAPNGDGEAGQVLATYGDGSTYWKTVQGGGGGGTSDYNDLEGKPSLNGVEIVGNKTAEDYGIHGKAFYAEYGEASLQDVLDAIDDGMLPFTIYNQEVYVAGDATGGDRVQFFSCSENAAYEYVFREVEVTSGGWSYQGTKTMESTSLKVTSLSSASTHKQYPSAKAVYDEFVSQSSQIGQLAEDIEEQSSQIESLGSTVAEHTTQIAQKATKAVYTATLNTTWSGSTAPFTKAQTINGILATDYPIVDLVPSTTFATAQSQEEAWAKIVRIAVSANTLTFYASEKPTVSLPIKVMCVR